MYESPHLARAANIGARTPVVPHVMIVDDDISVRESIELLVQSVGWQALTFSCIADFLVHPRAIAPCCLVLDISLPDGNGLDLQDQIAAERDAMPIVFISGCVDIPTTVRAIKSGATDVITKPLQGDSLLAAIERAFELSRINLRRGQEMAAVRKQYALLTRREAEVMALVVAGRMNKHVAAELSISEITVKAHRGKMMRKMCARTLPDLVRMATQLAGSN